MNGLWGYESKAKSWRAKLIGKIHPSWFQI